jgi:hypothetical protein
MSHWHPASSLLLIPLIHAIDSWEVLFDPLTKKEKLKAGLQLTLQDFFETHQKWTALELDMKQEERWPLKT